MVQKKKVKHPASELGIKKSVLNEVRKSYKLTSDCYERAYESCGLDVSELREVYYNTPTDAALKEWKDAVEVVDIAYRKEVCKLPTNELEKIVTFYKIGYQKRSEVTIQSITTEILERALNEERKGTSSG